MIALAYDAATGTCDLVIDPVAGGLKIGDRLADLETMVLASLFSDARALPDDRLPDAPRPDSDRRGWCGDALRPVANDVWGSRLWLLSREKQTAAVRQEVEDYAREALDWLITDKWATSATVTAEWVRTGMLGLWVVVEGSAGRLRRRVLVGG